MEFKKLDLTTNNIHQVASLVFNTEPDLSSILFGKSKKRALKRIKNIIRIGGNSLGHENVYLVLEGDEIQGLTIFYKGKQTNKKIESDKFSEALDFLGIVRMYIMEKLLINRLLTKDVEEYELYVSNISVDKKSRGKGVGKFLIKNIIEKAQSKGCKSIVLDVSKENEIALSLYKKFGFKIVKERKSKIYNVSVYKMIKEI